MKLQPLYDLQQEINRLFIAGSKFAKGDPRLTKHIPVFNKLGEKAPVFKKLADDIEDLINTDTQLSAEKLSAVSVLLYSILYTQGDTFEEGMETKPLEPLFNIDTLDTDFSYRRIKPVIEALTTTKSGRLEIVRDAVKEGLFKDFRTYRYVDFALGDKYAELVAYVEEVVAPSIGKGLVPFLLHDFEYDNKPENVRRLRLLGMLGYEHIGDMCAKILSENLPNMQAVVVDIMSNDSKNEALIIKLTDDKNKTVREAAYMALAKYNTESGLNILKDALLDNKRKGDLEAVCQALATTDMPFFFKEVFNEVSLTFQGMISAGKKADEKQFADGLTKFSIELRILENKDYPEVYEFLPSIPTHPDFFKLNNSYNSSLRFFTEDVMEAIVKCLDTLDKNKVVEVYEYLVDEVKNSHWNSFFFTYYFFAYVEAGHSKEEIYDKFNKPYLEGRITFNHIYSMCTEKAKQAYIQSHIKAELLPEKIACKFDHRWLPLIYKYFEKVTKWNIMFEKAIALLNIIEPADSETYAKFLVDSLKFCNISGMSYLFGMIIARQIPDCYNIIYTALSKFNKGAEDFIYYSLGEQEFWSKFPKEYAPKFRELFEIKKIGVFEEIASKIENQ